MKSCLKNPFIVSVLVAGLGFIAAGPLTAQTFTNLHNFPLITGTALTNSDGADPINTLVLSGDTLFGTASGGGASGYGTIFSLKTDGSGFTNLYNFATLSTNPPNSNIDGADPLANLLLSGDVLYGTTLYGGASGYGTVFAINTNGAGITNVHSFAGGTPGGNPNAGLVLSGNALYGTAELGGPSGNGEIFRVYTNGTGFTNIHFFSGGKGGATPQASLILSGDTLYGTASLGGIGPNGGNGIVFAIGTNGLGFTNLHSFNASNDGAYLLAGLVLSGDTLYGTAEAGGIGAKGGSGTVFSLKTNGSSFTVMHSFSATGTNSTTNSDGANPSATLILSSNTLYGTTDIGGASGNGTVFSIDTTGSNFMSLYSFTGVLGGSYPHGGLVLGDNALYGTTEFFGSGGSGIVYRLLLGSANASQPEIASVTLVGTNLVIKGTDGRPGATYVTLTSPSLALPLGQWTPVATIVLGANGDFTITVSNTVDRALSERFYILESP